MRLLLSSPHAALIESLGKRLSAAGIACEVRYRPGRAGAPDFSKYRELWVKVDNELQWASSLLALDTRVARN